MRVSRVHVFVLGAMVSAAACTSAETPTPGEQQQQAPSSSGNEPKAPNTGPAVPEGPVDPSDDPHAPACTGAAGELYALSVRKLAGTEDIPLCRYKGHVILVVNGASHCGQTYQYEPLQTLYDKYKDQKFAVLAFPSKSFNQEEPTDGDVSTFCTNKYHITFPLFTIDNVAKDKPKPGDVAQPVYQWLNAQPDAAYAASDPRSKDPKFSTPVPWNFEKFLISREGKIVRRFLYTTNPTPTVASPASVGGNGKTNVVDDAIKVELAKP